MPRHRGGAFFLPGSAFALDLQEVMPMGESHYIQRFLSFLA
jgi:hypothetical protein